MHTLEEEHAGARRPRSAAACPRVLLVCLAAALCLVLVGAGADGVRAAGRAPRLEGRVTDAAGVLAGDTRRVEAGLRRVRQGGGVDLHALYVRSTDGRSVGEYAEAAAAENVLAGDDALLVVAVADGAYGLWVGDRVRVDGPAVERLLAAEVEPALADRNLAGAAVAAAEALSAAAGGNGQAARRGGGLLRVALAVVAAGLLAGVAALRRQRAAASRAPAADLILAEHAPRLAPGQPPAGPAVGQAVGPAGGGRPGDRVGGQGRGSDRRRLPGRLLRTHGRG